MNLFIRGMVATAACSAAVTGNAVAAPPAQLKTAQVAAIDAIAKRSMESGTPGLAIAVSGPGGLRLHRVYGRADLESGSLISRRTIFPIASMTKQFTAAAVLSLAEDRLLSVDDPLSRFLPDFPNARAISIRQLLTHTSGIADYAEDPAGEKTKSVARSPEEMVAWIAGLKPLFAPGAGWAYSNSNYQLLGRVIEAAAKKPIADVFAERLFRRAGMTDTAFNSPSEIVPGRAEGYRKSKTAPGGFINAAWIDPSMPGPAGALRSTIDDLLRWNDALYGGRILRPESLAMMVAPGRLADGRTTKAAMPPPMQAGWNSDYAMGIMTGSPSGRARYWHPGDIDGFASWMAYYPDRKTTIVILHNSQSAERFENELEDAVFGPTRTAKQKSSD